MIARPLLAFAIAVGACGGVPRPVPVSGAGCADAGARLDALGCPEARTRKGHTFRAVCENAAANGHAIATECIAGATDCRQVALCR